MLKLNNTLTFLQNYKRNGYVRKEILIFLTTELISLDLFLILLSKIVKGHPGKLYDCEEYLQD
jgi:hypothetical protein